MDLNVYEDDDDETLHRKLIAAKIARKRAEEDMKLLLNRISLLRQEEQKVSIGSYCVLLNINNIHFWNVSNYLLCVGMEKDRWD